MQAYKNLLQSILNKGIMQFNTRTGKNCLAIVGYQMQFDTSEYFPATTMRRLPFQGMRGELLGFYRGYTNAADFRQLGCNFWHKNANETKAWLDSPFRKGTDDLGPIYGKQWTDWKDVKYIPKVDLQKYGTDYKVIGEFLLDGVETYVIERHINQLENALRTIITNPSDRRIIVTGWNVSELDQMSLVPCHKDYLFVPMEDTKTLHCVMTIRSWDAWLGAPSNIASTALFLAIMARLSGYKPGTITIQATNAHLYENSIEATEVILEREPRQLPKLFLSDNIKPITNWSDINGVFSRIQPEDIELVDYNPNTDDILDADGNKIVVEMAA